MEFKYLVQNKQALEKAKRFFPNLRAIFESKPTETLLCLKNICHLGCANCGSGQIDEEVLKTFDFKPEIICKKCQDAQTNNTAG